jgi:FO synthase
MHALKTSLQVASNSAVRADIRRWAGQPLEVLMAAAAALRDAGHGAVISCSRKVFIPLTRLCRDTCRYC